MLKISHFIWFGGSWFNIFSETQLWYETGLLIGHTHILFYFIFQLLVQKHKIFNIKGVSKVSLNQLRPNQIKWLILETSRVVLALILALFLLRARGKDLICIEMLTWYCLSQNVKMWYFLLWNVKIRYFCRKMLKYAFGQNDSGSTQDRRKWRKKCHPGGSFLKG